MKLQEQGTVEWITQTSQRLDALEQAVLKLARHVGAVGWNHELQQTLDLIRDSQREIAERYR